MGDLRAAHVGYEYQDLVTAIRAVDLMLGDATQVLADRKLVTHDRFDDLTTLWSTTERERCQIKHTDAPEPVSIDTFIKDGVRNLALDKLVKTAIADRETFPQYANSTRYRLFLRAGPPEDPDLTAVLFPVSPVSSDPGPLLPGTSSQRLAFDADKLWAGVKRLAVRGRSAGDAYGFLRAESANLTFDDLKWLCERLTVEVDVPAMSGDLTAPGPAEQILLDRVRNELGAGIFPNEGRGLVDVAEAIITAARNARGGRIELERDDLFRRTNLRQDFGAVARRQPTDPELVVERPGSVADLFEIIEGTETHGGVVIIEGEPGQGKSWLCEQLMRAFTNGGWTVAEHYCFLNDADDERGDRVMAEKIFGSLLERLASQHPHVVAGKRPLLSADEQDLMHSVQTIVADGLRVALLVDGLDHVTRVLQGRPGRNDPSYVIAQAIAALEPPAGCVVVVLSQPGAHLDPLRTIDTTTFVPAPSMTRDEVLELATNMKVLPLTTPDPQGDADSETDTEEQRGFEDALIERANGNPLYATYLCRESLGGADEVSAVDRILTIPPYAGSLEIYYEYLWDTLDDGGQAAADLIALVDFPLSAREIREILPSVGNRVDKALKILGPVLRSVPGHGLKIYHESFSRYLLRQFDTDPAALQARLEAVADWLTGLGFFNDARAFNSLLPVLSAAGNAASVVDIVDRSFAASAVAAGFSTDAIRVNLAVAVSCASKIDDWSAIARCIEAVRAAETFDQERLGPILARYVDVQVAVLGLRTAAERLLYQGRPVMAAEPGLRICAELDKQGAVVPWIEYLRLWDEESAAETHSYQTPDTDVHLALIQGEARLAAPLVRSEDTGVNEPGDGQDAVEVFRRGQVDWGDRLLLDEADIDREDSPPQPRDAATEPMAQVEDQSSTTSEDRGDSAEAQAQRGAADGASGWAEEDGGSETADAESVEVADFRLEGVPDSWSDVLLWIVNRLNLLKSSAASFGVVDILVHTFGEGAVLALVPAVEHKGAYYLAIAEAIADGRISAIAGSAQSWADKAWSQQTLHGYHRRFAALGVSISDGVDPADLRSALVDLTTEIRSSARDSIATRWLDLLTLASGDELSLTAAEATITGEGWYPCWLRFCIGLARAENAPESDQPRSALDALHCLTVDVRPFAGSPRACDLYGLETSLRNTIERAICLVDQDNWRTAVQLLVEVGESVNTTLNGEMGHPLPIDELSLLALRTAPASQRDYVESLVQREIAENSGSRFYSDIAEFKLILARLELLRDGARSRIDRVKALWQEACSLFLTHGFHKDVTAFEILAPLDALIGLDPPGARQRLARTQELAYRIFQHSDGRETRHAPKQWWKLLAEADPINHAALLNPAALTKCDESTLWEEARIDLWKSALASADPFIATALALTLNDTPTRPELAPLLKRLLPASPGTPEYSLLLHTIARADEVPTSGDHESAPGDERIADLHAIAIELGARARVVPKPKPGEAPERPLRRPSKTTVQEQISRLIRPHAADGAAGIPGAIRAWRKAETGLTDDRDPGRFDQFANAIGFRVLELASDGRTDEAARVLKSLAETFDSGDSHHLLLAIAEGLALRGVPGASPLASQAYALAWTQARGRGGWYRFGGTTAIEALHEATKLDADVARKTVAGAIEQAVGSNSMGTIGVTQGTIHAFLAGALKLPTEDALVTALTIWDEAFEMIDARAPGYGSDGSPIRYTAPPADEPEATVELINLAMGLATFGGLAQPGREAKRRTFLAVGLLVDQRPDLAAAVLPAVLRSLESLPTLTWLLTMLADGHGSKARVCAGAESELRMLTQSPFLTVRSLARGLLPQALRAKVPLGPSDPTKFPALLEQPSSLSPPSGRLRTAIQLIGEFSSARIDQGETILPGFSEAVLEATARAVDDDGFRKRVSESIRNLGGNKDQWPDAILPLNHATEQALQEVAGAGRAVLYGRGVPTPEPAAWEADLALGISHTMLPLILEQNRGPRPNLDPPPGSDDPMWEIISTAASLGVQLPGSAADDAGLNMGDTPGIETTVLDPVVIRGASESDEFEATIREEKWTATSMLVSEPYDGWHIIGAVEDRRSPARGYNETDLHSCLHMGLERQSAEDDDHFLYPPFVMVSVGQWFDSPVWPAHPATLRGPLLALAVSNEHFRDDASALGLPTVLLAPSPPLVAVLNLRPTGDLVMVDDQGPALALVSWRADYSSSDHFLAYPRLAGCAIVLRPDLVEQLAEKCGDDLTLRWHVRGSTKLKRPARGTMRD